MFPLKKLSYLIVFILLFNTAVYALEGEKQVAYGLFFRKLKDVGYVFHTQTDSPAYNVLLRGDKITKINNQSIANLNTQESMKLLEGPSGTVAKLEILRNNETLIKEITKKEIFVSDYIKIDNKHYMNWKEIQIDKDNNAYTWIKILNPDMNDKELLYSKVFWGANCNSYYMTELEHIDYYKNGKYIQYPSIQNKNEMKWSRTLPHSVGEVFVKTICFMTYPTQEVADTPTN